MPKQSDALFEETVFISKEFGRRVHAQRQRDHHPIHPGFSSSRSKVLPNDGTYHAQLPVWTASAMDFGTWDTDITRVYEDMALRATPGPPTSTVPTRPRVVIQKRIVEIKCKVSE